MLPQLDEYPAIFLENLQRPKRAPFVAGLEHAFFLVWVVELVPLIECRSVTATSQYGIALWAGGHSTQEGFSLVYTEHESGGHPP